MPPYSRSPSPSNSESQSDRGSNFDPEQQAGFSTHLEIPDPNLPGARRFLDAVDDASSMLNEAAHTVLQTLYPCQESHPTVRSITLIIRDFDGVGYTADKNNDPEHKDIHFSTRHIESTPEDRVREEINGVIVHEMTRVAMVWGRR